MTGAPERKEHPSAKVPHGEPTNVHDGDAGRPEGTRIDGTLVVGGADGANHDATRHEGPDRVEPDRAEAAHGSAAHGGAVPRPEPGGGGAVVHPDPIAHQDPEMGDLERAPQPPNVAASPAAARGTTHDPHSVTTGTEAEPTHDVFPPRGER